MRRVAMRRPDRLAGDATGDAIHRSFCYDGKVFSALDKEQNVWASGTVPPTIDEALDWVFDQTGTVVPLADFLYADVYARLMEHVQRGVYLGIHEAAGVPCHHLSFEQATIDWQLWIDAGPEPLPRKLVIAYKTEDEVPQYAVTIRKWNLQAKLPDALFQFSPPEGATRVDVVGVWRAAGRPHGRTEMTRQLTALFTATALIVASADGLFAQRRTGPRGSVSAASSSGRTTTHQAGQHHHDARDSVPLERGRSSSRATATTSTARSRPTAARRSPSARRSTSRTAEVDRSSTTTNQWGQSASREREVEGQGGYATVEGSAKTSTGREASADLVGRPEPVWPARRGRQREHEVQRQLQRRGRAQSVRRIEHGRRRSIRRQGDEDAAVRVPHHHLLRPPVLLVRWRVLPTLHASRRSLLLPGARALLRLLRQPARRRHRRHRGWACRT